MLVSTALHSRSPGGAGSGGIAIWAGASLALEHVSITGALGSGAGGVTNPAAVSTFGTGSLSVSTSEISGTVNGAGVTDDQSGGTFTIGGSTISGNGTATSGTRKPIFS